MADLFDSIRKSSAALEVLRKAVDVTGRNIVGAKDPHYARQVVDITSLGTYEDSQGFPNSFGVDISRIYHLRSQIYDDAVNRNLTSLGSIEAQYKFGSTVDAYFESELENVVSLDNNDVSREGIGGSMNDFFNAFNEFSAATNELSQKTIVIDKGSLLVDRFNQMATNLSYVDTDIVNQIDSDIVKVNNLLDEIAKLNRQISEFEIGNKSQALDNRDLRQKALEELAGYINFTVKDSPSAEGSINLTIKDTGGGTVTLIDRFTVKEGIAFDGTIYITASTSPTAINITGGRLKGYLTIREGTLADTRTGLDNLVNQLVTSVNAAYNPTTLTGNFFKASGTTASTIALDTALNTSTIKASDTTDHKANELAIAVYELSQNVFSTGGGDFIDGTFTENYASLVVSVGQDVQKLDSQLETENITLRASKEQREIYGGVSLNEEVTDLLAYQKSIQATVHFTRIAGDLLDTIINGMFR